MTSQLWRPRRPMLLVLVGMTVLSTAPLYAQERSTEARQCASEERLRKDVSYLASDELQGRGISTHGIQVAADHIAREFQKSGLKPVAGQKDYFQHFDVDVGAAKLEGSNSLHLHGPQGQELKLELDKEFQVLGMSGSGKVDAPVVFVGFGLTLDQQDYDEYRPADVAGKVVVVLRRTPYFEDPEKFFQDGSSPQQHAALDAKMAAARLHKAAAVIFVNDRTMAKDEDALMGFDYTARGGRAVLPAVHILREVVDKMLASSASKTSLAALEKETERTLKPQSKLLEGWTANLEIHVSREKTAVKNVIGVLEGSGPLADETVVIGAHYDHLGFGGKSRSAKGGKRAIYYGADDNGSGSTVVLELARRFGAIPNRQGRRLVFMTFSAEESGLLGSAYYCRHPLLPLEKTAVMINLDQVGRLRLDKASGKDKLEAYGLGTGTGFKELVERLNRKHHFQMQKELAAGGGSDHVSFYSSKVPVLGFYTGGHPDYHQPGDTADKINVVGMRRVADLTEDLASALASTPERPLYIKNSAKQAGRTAGSAPRLGITPSNENDGQEGVLIANVAADSPAFKAGLRKGDRIVAADGKPIKNLGNYLVVMRSHKKGDRLDVDFLREGKKQSVKVMLK